MKKKIITIVISLLVVAGLLDIGLILYRRHRVKANPAKVYSVTDSGWVGNYYEMPNTMDGSVVQNQEQEVHATADQVISEIYGTVGDAVRAGDKLLSFDATKDTLTLNSANADLEADETDLTIAQNEMNRLNQVQPIPEEPAVTDDVKGMDDQQYQELSTMTPGDAAIEYPGVDISVLLQQYPVYKQWTSQCDAIRAANAAIYHVSVEDVTDYTAEDLAKARREQSDKIRDLKLKIENGKLDVQRKEKKVENQTVTATMNGVIQSINVSAQNIAEGKPVMVVATDGSMSARVNADEFHLKTMSVGDAVSVTSYDTGNQYNGVITAISETPSESYDQGSGSVSLYPVTISIDDSQDLSEGGYVEVQTIQDTTGGDLSSQVVLPLMFVRQENGKYYVMKDQKGKLKKQFVSTGKIYYGTNIVIRDGVSPEDSLAFPYAKESKEGNPCVKGSVDEIYQ